MLNSVPRFFEFETTHRQRPLCPIVSENTIHDSYSSLSSSAPHQNVDTLSILNAILKENHGIEKILESKNYTSTNCNTSLIKDHLVNIYMDKTQETATVYSQNSSTSLCKMFKIEKEDKVNTILDENISYPMINEYNDECHCSKDRYEASEEPNCFCKETNETCNLFDVVPRLYVTDMRFNEYYISVSSF